MSAPPSMRTKLSHSRSQPDTWTQLNTSSQRSSSKPSSPTTHHQEDKTQPQLSLKVKLMRLKPSQSCWPLPSKKKLESTTAIWLRTNSSKTPYHHLLFKSINCQRMVKSSPRTMLVKLLKSRLEISFPPMPWKNSNTTKVKTDAAMPTKTCAMIASNTPQWAHGLELVLNLKLRSTLLQSPWWEMRTP